MKFCDLLKYSYLKTIRNKKNIYFILILAICSVLLLTVLNYMNAFMDSLNNSFINDPNERKLVVFPDENAINEHWLDLDYDYGFERILELEHVTDVYLLSYEQVSGISSFKDNDHTGTVGLLYGSEATVPKIVAGKMFDRDETGVAVCPDIFYPSADINDARGMKKPFFIKDDLLDKKFSLDVDMYEFDTVPNKVGTYTQEFKIVGLYKSVGNNYSQDCYVSSKDIESLWSISIANQNDPQEYRDFAHVVVIDDLKNIDEVKKQIMDMGFRFDTFTELDYQYVNKIRKTCLVILSLVILAIMLLTVFYAKKKIHNNSYEMGLSKAIGYSSGDVIKISSMQIFYMTLNSSAFAIIIYKLLLVLVKTQFKNLLIIENAYYYFTDTVKMALVAVLIIVIVPTIANVIITGLHLNDQLVNLMRNDKE